MKTSQSETPLEALQNKFSEIPDEIEIMSTLSVEGLCAAVAVCPNQISENKWTPLIWGKDGVPSIIKSSEINYIRKLLLNYYKHLNSEIKRGNYQTTIHSEFNASDWQKWMTGFEIGLNIDFNAWDKIKMTGNELSKFSLWVMINLIKLLSDSNETLKITRKICERQVFRLVPYYLYNLANYSQSAK